MDVRRLAREERADFAAFLATLSPQQWQAPTLCAGWRVRDVVAHVISYDDLDTRHLLAYVIQGRLRLGRVNAAALARYNARSPEQLLALLTDHPQPRGVPAALGGRVGLTEALIHHQDIRRPLGQPRTIPPERLLPALRTALIAPDIGGLWRIRGIRLVATVFIAITPAVHAMIWPGTVAAVASPVRITFAIRSVPSALTGLKLVMSARRPVWRPG